MNSGRKTDRMLPSLNPRITQEQRSKSELRFAGVEKKADKFVKKPWLPVGNAL